MVHDSTDLHADVRQKDVPIHGCNSRSDFGLKPWKEIFRAGLCSEYFECHVSPLLRSLQNTTEQHQLRLQAKRGCAAGQEWFNAS